MVPLLFFYLMLMAASVDGFLPAARPRSVVASPFRGSQKNSLALFAAADDDEEDDDDEYDIDDSSLGDWRKFRASLIDEGLPGEETKDEETTNNNAISKTEDSKKKTRKSVAAKNEKLLEEQNAQLAEEYKAGIWAHTIQQAEVGGLLCRMPLEAELYLGDSAYGGYWKQKLDLMLTDTDNSKSDVVKGLQLDEDPETVTIAKVDQWFTVAERMIHREMKTISESGKIKNGVLNKGDLEPNERLLLEKYMSYQQSWQEICLVTAHNPGTGCSEALCLNRPITKSINKQVATLLLQGKTGSGAGSFSYDFVDMVVQAFGKEAGVYLGGSDLADEPAMLIHGIPNLPGARELAPGTSIFCGGWEAAVEGVLKGLYKPLDFRFFIGRQSYDPKHNPERGNLVGKIQQGSYQPIACARPLALKQCLGLPKPLWHEVLEMCGGELKALSSIELKKRADLEQS